MIIDEAIELLSNASEGCVFTFNEEFKEALRWGATALQTLASISNKK